MLKYQLLDPKAKGLYVADGQIAGADFHTFGTHGIPAKSFAKIRTGVRIEVPKNCFAQIMPRSSSFKLGLVVTGGVIDQDYRGEIIVIVVNINDYPIVIEDGCRIAQVVLVKNYSIERTEETFVSTDTVRSEKGFGSSGFF